MNLEETLRIKIREVVLCGECILPETLRSAYKNMASNFGLHKKTIILIACRFFFLPGSCALYIDFSFG